MYLIILGGQVFKTLPIAFFEIFWSPGTQPKKGIENYFKSPLVAALDC